MRARRPARGGPPAGLTRREFLGRAAAFAVPAIVPASVLGRVLPPPSRRITMAVIGCGIMGGGHVDGLRWRDDVQVLAVCDVEHSRRRQAAAKIAKRYAERAGAGSFAGVADENDFRAVLARRDLDAVVIATPDHWHAPIAVAAARAGKDVYLEKPVSLTVRQGRAIATEMAARGRVFTTGSWQRSLRDFRLACELVRNGRLGRVRTITCTLPGGQEIPPQPAQPVPEGFDYGLWLGPAPRAPYTEKRCHRNFRWISDYAGGGLTDWGAHHLDIAQWALGTDRSGPAEIRAEGAYPADGLYDNPLRYRVTYAYPGGVAVIARSGSPYDVLFEGERGWIRVSREQLDAGPRRILGERVGPEENRLERSDDHTGNFLARVRDRGETITPAEVAHRSATMCHLGNLSLALGRPLRWDPARERFRDDAEADRLLERPLRGPWTL